MRRTPVLKRAIALVCVFVPFVLTAQDTRRPEADAVTALRAAPGMGIPWTFRWGPQRPDLMRYNRVEGLSVGARGQLRPQTSLGPISATLTARLGSGDLDPNGRLDLTQETLDRRITFSGYHELAAIDQRARHLGVGNSLMAALFGRDDGDYYRRSGAALEWSPPTPEMRKAALRLFGEYHRPASVEADFIVWGLVDSDQSFRDNIEADAAWLYGGELELRPRWGTDPAMARGGLDLLVEGVTGDYEFVRSAVLGLLAMPLPARMRLGLEAGAGHSWGSLPVQKMWYVGGPSTLRGLAPLAMAGSSYVRGRAELARTLPFGALSLFFDVGWAGTRDAFEADDALRSVGVGLSIVDGLIRIDSAWELSGTEQFRLDVYLNQSR